VVKVCCRSDISINEGDLTSSVNIKHQNGDIILPNKKLMLCLLNRSIKTKQPNLTIMHLTIENFNRILYLFHGDTNQVYSIFVHTLRQYIKEDDFIAQIGESKFVIIVNLPAVQTGREFVEKFHKDISKVINVRGQDIFFKTKIGASALNQQGNLEKLFFHSMIAMEWNLRHHDNEVSFFNRKMLAKLNKENKIESLLRKAIENNELSVVYQPQIDIQKTTKKMIGMEALVRWNNSSLGWVSPEIFIPIAEKTQLMVEIGEWIINEVCKNMQQMKNQFSPAFNLKCAINISAVQMADEDLTQKLFKAIEQYHIQSHQIEFEITETSLLKNKKHSIHILNKVRKCGITVAIDDFGTGYSSLSYLNALPIDKIKIDRSFIKDYPETDDGSLAKILVDMSKTMQKKVLTEGAETQAQVNYLRSIGCDYIQGYFYSKPLPLDEFMEFVQKHT